MNQREILERMLINLCTLPRKRHGAAMIEILDFVDSFIIAELDTTDPRVNLRPIIVRDCGPAFFHQFFVDADSEAQAVFEYPSGEVGIDSALCVQFTDVPEVKQ